MTDLDEHTPIDFSALGPPMVREKLDALVAAAAQNATGELERRRGAIAVVRVVIAWRRPLLAMSGLAAAAAVILMTQTSLTGQTTDNRSPTTVDSSVSTVAEALGIPSAYAESVEGSAQRGGAKR